jgi:hypothetical protein
MTRPSRASPVRAALSGGIPPGARRRLGRVSQRSGLLLLMAERVGFEPTNTREDVTGIPVQRLRPLGHLSVTKR